MEVLDSRVKGSVDVEDIWLDPVDAVVVESFILGGVDGAAPIVDDEVDDGLLYIDEVTAGWVDVEPTIPPRYPRVEAPTIQELPP